MYLFFKLGTIYTPQIHVIAQLTRSKKAASDVPRRYCNNMQKKKKKCRWRDKLCWFMKVIGN